ncbi:hypothetical protein GCM10010176_082370 [Nonomuraea spiralis]|nr:hypothetical protein GCM10010176_082370 [Nonomuraea spiralis]
MAFPDWIERSVELTSPPEQVRVALTTSEGRSSQLEERVAIDLRLGGVAQMTVRSGLAVDMRVERAGGAGGVRVPLAATRSCRP